MTYSYDLTHKRTFLLCAFQSISACWSTATGATLALRRPVRDHQPWLHVNILIYFGFHSGWPASNNIGWTAMVAFNGSRIVCCRSSSFCFSCLELSSLWMRPYCIARFLFTKWDCFRRQWYIILRILMLRVIDLACNQANECILIWTWGSIVILLIRRFKVCVCFSDK